MSFSTAPRNHCVQGGSMIQWIVDQPYCYKSGRIRQFEERRSEEFSTRLSKEDTCTWCLKFKPNGESNRCDLNLVLIECKSPHLSVNVTIGVEGCPVSGLSRFWERTFVRKGYSIDVFASLDEIRTAYEITHDRGGLLVHCQITIYDSFAHEKVVPHDMYESQVLGHSMPKDFISMMENGRLSDVKLVIGKQKLLAHKLVLAFRSPVFMSMFENEMQETLSNEVVIPDISFDVMQKLLIYIYTDKVENIEDVAEDLLGAAEKYQLEGLKFLCSECLVKKFKENNLIKYLILGDFYRANYLKEQSMNFMIKQIENVQKMEGFEELASTHPVLLKEILIHISKAKVHNSHTSKKYTILELKC